MKWPWHRDRGPAGEQLDRLSGEAAKAEAAERAARQSLAEAERLAREREAMLAIAADIARMGADDRFQAPVAQQILDAVRQRREQAT